jgi:SAM-dependent methyltransferase
MAVPSDYPFNRYLSAKKTVDDRSLNKNVWESLKSAAELEQSKGKLKVLEIGCGIGTMIERSLEWGLLKRAEYTALDAMAENIDEAAARLPVWAGSNGYIVDTQIPGELRIVRDQQDVTVRLQTADVFDFMGKNRGQRCWNLLVANAFLDLVDVTATLPKLLALLEPEGLFYFTITFDGATILQPEIDPALDARIEALYHETMDKRIIGGKLSGDSRTGRHLFKHLGSLGVDLLAAGASDWVVFAGPTGYPGDEEFFMHFLVHTIGTALQGHPELNAQKFDDWVKTRHRQIGDRSLVYIAHQLDFLGRVRR